ncbi:MAG: surface antigen [Bacteroidetes bacterium]|nr:surface antigen [Bacteroidota bacterium]
MKFSKYSRLILFGLLAVACNPTKYVPDNEFLLNKTRIESDNKTISKEDINTYLRQTPNTEIFGLFKLQLGIYNLSGSDTSKWINRWLKKIGDEPVIYNPSLTTISEKEISKLMGNKGYMDAEVKSNVTYPKKKVAEVKYIIQSNQPYKLHSYSVNISQKELSEIASDTTGSLIKTGKLFDSDLFDQERDRITSKFRGLGYFNFTKDYLHYYADSTLISHQIDMVLELSDQLKNADKNKDLHVFQKYTIDKVHFLSESDKTLDAINSRVTLDTLTLGDYELVYENNRNIRPTVLIEHTFIVPGKKYSDRAVERTYSSLNSLSAVKYVNVSFKETAEDKLDCYIVITPNKLQSISADVEGTYSSGYLGFGGNINYGHRNAFKGSETFSVKGRMAYEYQGSGQNAIEVGGDVAIKFPTFLLPFSNLYMRRNIRANTEISATYSYRDRPKEYTGIVTGIAYKYSWSEKYQIKHNFDVLDINYVNYPKITGEYQAYINSNPAFAYNFQPHLIMRTGYSGTYSDLIPTQPLRNHTTISYGIETAGNILQGINTLFHSQTDSLGAYKVFGIRYAQYVKTDYQISYHQIFDENNRIAFHAGLGVAIPFGNSDKIPFEKRYFSGGANSVRGWIPYQLGPGTYKSPSNYVDYNTQRGDIKIDLNMEYRTKLFWKLDGAFFLDAGNVWTIRNYDEQPGGVFRFNSFLGQMGIAYGTGIRADFSFFVLRVDLGFKLFNPALERTEQWRTKITSNDYALNLAIGYPF